MKKSSVFLFCLAFQPFAEQNLKSTSLKAMKPKGPNQKDLSVSFLTCLLARPIICPDSVKLLDMEFI